MNFRFKLAALNSSRPIEITNVYVVDSDPAVRQKLETLINAAGWQPRMAGSAEEFLARPTVVGPGCLLVDLDLPDMSGLELQKLLADRPELPVIFMSTRADVHAAVLAIKAGAIEFLTKPVARDVYLSTIRAAIEQSRAALRQLVQSEALHHRYESLSRREREVMNLVVIGRLNKQVGGELGISEITVKAHRGKLMRKMQAASFAELVNMAASLHGETRVA